MNTAPRKLDDRAKDLFAEALELAESERAAFLARACGDDHALRAGLETLLRGHGDAEARFEERAAAVAEQPGDRIGHYKLLQRIGEGGFGTVWMAEQEEPVRRKVALKVLKAGMDTAQVVGRFEGERQALALMEHPNIAKVFDGGATPSGRPYFVMELVRGVPITQYCDEAGLGMVERLELFVPVCQAVQHAHHKGVIHRDIKPGNVLVTLHDGRPVPKVIDFGIAKATTGALTQRTVFTEFRQMLGTPEYMAPEQAELSGLDVDTRADVYSLGVLLYELLTGTRPFELRTLLAAGYAEMLRTIREVDPPKPSTRVSTLGDGILDVAKHRKVHPRSLGALMRGDLDWIVMKALEKERGRRYDTATALCDDVLRHLHHEPVLAGPPSRAYRLRKYVRRHRVGVGAGVAILAALSGGAAVAMLGWAEASAQWERAEERAAAARREAQTSAAVTDLVTSMLGSADPHESRGADYTVRQALDDFDRSLGDRLGDEPRVEARVRSVLGRSYGGLERPDLAEPQVLRALAICRAQSSPEQLDIATALFDLAMVRHGQNRWRDALATLDEAEAAILGDTDEHRRIRAKVLTWRCDLFGHLGESARAVELGRQALRLAEGVDAASGPLVELCSHQLASALIQAGRMAEAEPLLRRELSTHDERSLDTALAKCQLARCLQQQGRGSEAEVECRQALAIARELAGVGVEASSLLVLGDVLADQRRWPEAVAVRGEAVSALRSQPARVDGMLDALCGLSEALRADGRAAEAESPTREALALTSREAHRDQRPRVRSNLAPILEELGRFEEAEHEWRECLRECSQTSRNAAVTRKHLGSLLLRRGQLEEAERLLRDALAWFADRDGEDWNTISVTSSLVLVLDLRGEPAQALPLARDDYARSLRCFGPTAEESGKAAEQLATILCAVGQVSEALEILGVRIERARSAEPSDPQSVSRLLARQASMQLGCQDFAAAEVSARESLSLRESSGEAPMDVASSRALLGRALAGLGRRDEAEALLLAACPVLLSPRFFNPQAKRASLTTLIALLEARGETEPAAKWRRALEQLDDAEHGGK